ncbi:hypothetical protein ABZ815_17045 [Nonomuraea sp. NPDC047529]|uniref:phosphotransferase n=1 Tax=Nonomuraea sp. NPDC047529 TaxID=3155623 RepID=UPI0033EDC488
MRSKPADLDESLLTSALEAWGIEAAGPAYAPVGFGDHHWIATGADGRRWFLTAATLPAEPDERGSRAAFRELGRALETAAALSATLGFVVAPVPDLDGGALLRPLAPRYALSVFPFVEGVTGDFGDEPSDQERAQVIDLLAELHGEPHPGNLLRHRGRCLLVDWDTVGLAVPERDLWLVARTPDDLARYAAATGRTPDPAALALYRLRWSLDDVAGYVAWFRAPHGHTRDAELSWQFLTGAVDDLADGVASAL